MSKSTEKSIMRSLLIIVPGAFVLVVAVTATNKWPSIRAYRQQREERVKYVLPPVTSTLKGIDVVSAFVDEKGEAQITVTNNTDKGIRALAISSGTLMFSDDNGPRENGLPDLVAPHSTYTMEQPTSNLRINVPLRISAVVYDDKSEDGDIDARKSINDTREKEQRRRLLESKDKNS